MTVTPWVYRQTEPQLWTVGYYDPEGKWWPESDHGAAAAAADRVNFLNGTQREEPTVAYIKYQPTIADVRKAQRRDPAPISPEEQEEMMAEVARYQQWEDDTYGTAEDNYDGSP